MEETIELKDYFRIIKKNLKVISIITLAIGIIAGGIGLLSKPKVDVVEEVDREYQSSSKITISYNIDDIVNKVSQISDKEYVKSEIEKAINYNNSILKTYSEMAKSNIVIEKVIKNLGLDISVSELMKDITIWPIDNSQIISVSVKYEDPKIASDIANEIPKVFKENQSNLDVVIVDKAVESELPVPLLDEKGQPIPEVEETTQQAPNKFKNVVMNGTIGIVLGGMIALFIVFLREYMDNKLHNADQIETEVGMDVLGVIPKEKI